jgi:hypothetical protein
MTITSDDRRVYRVASLTLVNAMLFQEILSQRTQVATLRQTIESLDIVGKFNQIWKHIEKEVDFVPIFNVARKILLALPSSPETDKALRRLVQSAIRISRNRAALRHDLMGRIYHRLLADAKFYGAFYTKIPAATLLLKLALGENDWGIEWTKPASIAKLRIADLACGTGTLLKAAMAAIVDRHIDEVMQTGATVHANDVQRRLIENSLWGFDVLSSAVHLAASAIAMHNPDVIVQGMHLYALPLGGEPPRLGSIDFATSRTLHIQKTLIGASIGPEGVITKGKRSATLPLLHVCAMNPPFTRSVYGNLLFGAVEEAQRAELQRRLQNVRNVSRLNANITAGLGSIFVAIADNMLVQNGVLALVLPKAVLAGKAWEPTRELFRKYDLQYVICSHEPDNWNFSESTDLSECLLVLARGSGNTSRPTTFINLWEQPKSSVEALSIVGVVHSTTPADLGKTSGTAEIRTHGKKFGEIVRLSLGEGDDSVPWVLPVAFAQTDLSRIAYFLSEGKIFQPGVGIVSQIEMVTLSDFATLGPDGRDVYDGFSLTESHTPYPALWGHEAETLSKLTQAPNQYLAPLTEPRPGRNLRDANLLWSRSGTLMLPKELWLTTNRVTGVVLPNPALSNVWWPTRWLSDDPITRESMEHRLALWFNSTFGLFTVLMQRQETRGPWVKFPKAWYEKLFILDLSSLEKSENDALDTAWKEVHEKELQPFPRMNNDPVRKAIDDTFAQILNIPGEACDQLRSLLSREPVITMQVP